MDELERLNNELEQKKKELAEKQVQLENQNNEYNSKLVKLRANLNTLTKMELLLKKIFVIVGK